MRSNVHHTAMTSPIEFPALVIGLMSGTSADGVDAALICTDGVQHVQPIASTHVRYSDALRLQILGLMNGVGDEALVAQALTQVHAQAVEELIGQSKVWREEIKLIGFHGQTTKHQPERGITTQIGNAQWLADSTGIPVVFDFRSNDMKHGGQGAPLVPLYHAALARGLEKPVMIVNIGGVANVTWIGKSPSPLAGEGRDGGGGQLGAKPEHPPTQPSPAGGEGVVHNAGGEESLVIEAMDCGPGNALLDDWMGSHTGARCDSNGAAAKRGITDEAVVKDFLRNKFFVQNRARSLDRNHFTVELVKGMSMEDGAATLTAITAAAIGWSARAMPELPRQLLITGGGRHNPVMMRMIAERSGLPTAPVEKVGWQGDMLEAEAFAYLAVRSVRALPLSLPSTTGVSAPVSGGVLFSPAN